MQKQPHSKAHSSTFQPQSSSSQRSSSRTSFNTPSQSHNKHSPIQTPPTHSRSTIKFEKHIASVADFSPSTRLSSTLPSFSFTSLLAHTSSSRKSPHQSTIRTTAQSTIHALVSFSRRAQQDFTKLSHQLSRNTTDSMHPTQSSAYSRHAITRSIHSLSSYAQHLAPKRKPSPNRTACTASILTSHRAFISSTPSAQDDTSSSILSDTPSQSNTSIKHKRSSSHPNPDSLLDTAQITSPDELNEFLADVSPESLHQRDLSPSSKTCGTTHIPLQRKKVIIITGGTAVGKTSLSIELARKLNGEIISADSMQVYSHFDTGTAKIGLDETNGIPHHLVDIVPSGGTDFSASMFYQAATEIINNVISRKKTPILVGGTGLYLRWLLYGRPQGMNITPDQNSRAVCINFYMSYLTKGLTGWEKAAGAGKGVGKTQQVTHSENKFKFQPLVEIETLDVQIAYKSSELSQVLSKYPSTFYKDEYSQADVVTELINDELQHICISNQIRWSKVENIGTRRLRSPNNDGIDGGGIEEFVDGQTIYRKVTGIRKDLTNFHTYFPEFQSVPFLDTMYELYTTFYTRFAEKQQESDKFVEFDTAMKFIAPLFIQPAPMHVNHTTTEGQIEGQCGWNYTFYQNGFPFPTTPDQITTHLQSADHFALLYRIYTAVLTSMYSKECQKVLTNLFLNIDSEFNFNSETDNTINDQHSPDPIPVIQHQGNYYTPRLFLYAREFDSKTRSTNPASNSIDSTLSAILETFGDKLPHEVITTYVATLRSILSTQYHLHNSYRYNLDQFRTKFIRDESTKGVLGIIKPDDDHDEVQPPTRSSPSHSPQQQQQQQRQPAQSRSGLISQFQRNFLIAHASNLSNQFSTNPFELTMTSISAQRERFLNEFPEFVQLIDQCLEDPFNLLEKYSHIVDYTNITASTASTRFSVDGLLNTCFPGYDEPHALPPLTYSSLTPPSPHNNNNDNLDAEQHYQQSVQQLNSFSKKNSAMLKNCVEQVASGVARKIPSRLLASLTANTVFTVVPSAVNTVPQQHEQHEQHEQHHFIPHESEQTRSQTQDSQPNNLSNSLPLGLYKCSNDVYLHITPHKPTPSIHTPLIPIHPLNSLLFQNRLLNSKFKLPTIAWIEQYRNANDLYRLEKSICHALATDGVAVPPKYKDQMSIEPLQRLAGRIPDISYNDADNTSPTTPQLHNKHSKSLYNPDFAFSEGLINHYDVRCYFLHTQRNLHYRLADYRCEQMVRGGMLKETLLLLNTYNQSPSVVPFPITNKSNGGNHLSDSIAAGLITTGPNGETRGVVKNEVRGLWPTSPNFDYFMRSDVNGYLKRYFPHPLHEEPTLVATDASVNAQIEKNIAEHEDKGETSSGSSNTEVLIPSKTVQTLTSEWLYLDELMFSYRKLALPMFAQLFDMTFAIISSHLKSRATHAISPPIYHNQYKYQLLDSNAATLTSSDVYTSNALTTLTYSFYERTLAYTGYLLQFPDKIDLLFAHCGFTPDDLQHISSAINSNIISTISTHLRSILQTNQFYNFSLVPHNTAAHTKQQHELDPRLFLIAVAVNCFQIERIMVTYSPERDSSEQSTSKTHLLDDSYTYDILSPALEAIFGADWQNNHSFAKIKSLLATVGISLDHSIRSQLLEYDWSISDQYRSQNQQRVAELLSKSLPNKHKDTDAGHPSLSTKQHLFNYQIYNDNTSTLYKFTTGRSGSELTSNISSNSSSTEPHERLSDAIISQTPTTSFTLFPCEHLIHLPEIRLIQNTLPDHPYQQTIPSSTTSDSPTPPLQSTFPTQVLTKPVNINPLANTVISLFSPRVKSIGHTNILGFFTDSQISSIFSKWNDMMSRKEVERDELLLTRLLSEKHAEFAQQSTPGVVDTEAQLSNDSIEASDDTPIKKQKEYAVSSLTVDDSTSSKGRSFDVWKPKVWMSTSKDKSHHFLPTIGLTTQISSPDQPPPPQTEQSSKSKAAKGNHKVSQAQQAAARLPWNNNTEMQNQLLNTKYPINTSFVDGVEQLQTQGKQYLSKCDQNEPSDDQDIHNLRQFVKNYPNKPPIQVSIAELREIIPAAFITSFISLMNDFQVSTRGYIKRQHTFFQDEPLCQMVTIPYENIPLFMHSIDHSTYTAYNEVVQKFLKEVGSSYDSILHTQYDNAKEQYRLKLFAEQQRSNPDNPASSTSSISSTSSSPSTLTTQSDNISYPFSFPQTVNFAMLPKEQFAVKDVKFTNVHIGAYYKELMHQYIPQHVKNALLSQSSQNSSVNSIDEMIGLKAHHQPIENNAKHPLRRAMPVLYDFSDKKYPLLSKPKVLPQYFAPQFSTSQHHQTDPFLTDPTAASKSSLGIYKANLQHVINEICDDISTKPQHEYWEYMLQRYERKQNGQPPIKSYPYTTLSTIPPVLELCTDLTAFQSQLQLFWNDGIILETIVDLCEFQRGFSRIIAHHHSNPVNSQPSDLYPQQRPNAPLDVELLNYFTKHKTTLKQDLMSSRAIDRKTGEFLITITNDMTGNYSLSSPINNAAMGAKQSAEILDKSTASNVQSVRQHGISSNHQQSNGLGRRISFPWQQYVQIENNELLNTKHSY